MATTALGSVDDYLASQPEATRAVLERVRRAIRRALPDAVEVISYQIPAYRLHGAVVIYFAGWKEHYSLYPASNGLVAAFKEALAPYVISKGTIRFPLSQRVPATLISRIAKFRAKQADEQRKAKVRRRAVGSPPRAGGPRMRHAALARSRKATVTAADFRRIALSLEGAAEGSHMGAVDFRVGGRIFATLASIKDGFGNLMLTPEIQSEFVAEAPGVFLPVAGGWGRMGVTHIRLAQASHDVLAGALQVAWRLRVDKNTGSRKQTAAGTSLQSAISRRTRP